MHTILYLTTWTGPMFVSLLRLAGKRRKSTISHRKEGSEYADPFARRSTLNTPSVLLYLNLAFLEDLAGDGSVDTPTTLDFAARRSSTTDVSGRVLFLFFSTFFCDNVNASL